MKIGEITTCEGSIVLNEGRPTVQLSITNTGDRPVQVGSHDHFAEVNAGLDLDRDAARGMRLDIPAGTAVRLEPGDSTTVKLIPLGGDRVVHGFRDLVDGCLDPQEAADVSQIRSEDYSGNRRHAAGDAPQPLRERAETDYSNETR